MLDDDPDDTAVTDALLDIVDLAGELQPLVEALADLLEHATSPGTRARLRQRLGGLHRLDRPSRAPSRCMSPPSRADDAAAPAVRDRGGASHRRPALPDRARAGPPGGRRLCRKHGARPAGKTVLVTAPLIAICGRLHDRETAAAQLAAHVDALIDRPGAAAERWRAAGRLRAAWAAALRARRDRSLLLVGYAAALRRTELVALDLADLAETEHGLQAFIARSKTDQAALGNFVGIAHGHPVSSCTITCPVRAWTDWRDALSAVLAGLGEQLHPAAPAFRPLTRQGAIGIPGQLDPHARLTGQSVALAVKAAVALLDDPVRHPPGRYAGHSLRAGFATQAAAGVPLDRIMRQTRHSSVAVALRHIRPGAIWHDNPSAALGL